jgi:N-acetylmuramoyl-L-alanine amidase
LLCAASLLQPVHATATLRALSGVTVALDPGHNGRNASSPAINRLVDAGGFWKACDTAGTATHSGYPEHAFTWAFVLELQRQLVANGATVVLSRPDDHGVGPCIDERGRFANRDRATVAISIHGDGGPDNGRGFEVIEPGMPPRRDERLRANLHQSALLGAEVRLALVDVGHLEPSTYLGRNGVGQRSDLGGLNWSRVPKVMIELLNMRNRSDAAFVNSLSWRTSTAHALVVGIAWYLNGHPDSTTEQLLVS